VKMAEKNIITIGKVIRITQENGRYIVEEKVKDDYQEIATFQLGFDMITYVKGYLDEYVEQMKRSLPLDKRPE